MNLLSVRREVSEFRKRYKWMALAALIAFGALVVRAFHLQILRYDHYAAIARENITKKIELPAKRGMIRDALGRVIATNRPSYDLFITPAFLEPEVDLQRIANIMGLDADTRADFEARFARIPERRRTHQVRMFSDITREQMALLEMEGSQLKGIDVVPAPMRTYPFGSLAAHAIGYLNEVNREDIERLQGQGYRAGDVVGRSGIERAWEGYLRGRRGFRKVLVDVRGQLADGPRSNARVTTKRDPVPGRDLTVTLDMDLMRIVDRAFRGQPSGAVVAVEVSTGKVRALYSKPTYDLNEMTGRLTTERARELLEDPFRPLIDKTLYESYFPGSTFKPFTALAALGEGITDMTQRVSCSGSYVLGNRSFRCSQAHGEVDLRQALVRSCNIFFWDIATRIGLDKLESYANDFGLGRPTGIGINTEASGFIPNRAWYDRHYNNRFRLGFTLNEAIGQGNTRVTLIQLAMAYAAIANGGTLHVPQLVEKITSPDGRVIEEFHSRVRRNVRVPSANLDYVVQGMVGVVNDPAGTAYEAHIENGVPVAGKTGTAQVQRRAPSQNEDDRRGWYYNRDHAWFAGFAPADHPELVVVVIVEHGGGGGRNAAPIAIRILEDYLGHGSAERTASRDTASTDPASSHDARGLPGGNG